MKYVVSEEFYTTVSALVGVALQNEDSLEYELAIGLISDLEVSGDE
jgi:hypothetical protein